MRGSWSVWFGYSLALTWIGGVVAPSYLHAQAAQSGDEQAEAEQLMRMIQQYMTRGADATTVNRGPQAGPDYYRNGASALSVPSGKDPGADFYRRGADALSVGRDNADYFRNGANTTSVPSGNGPEAEYFRNGGQAMKVPSRGEPGAEYFNNGAQALKVPSRGEPGAEFFSNGATATALNPATKPPRRPANDKVEEPAEPAQPEQPAEAAAPAAESGEAKPPAEPPAQEAPPEAAPEAADAPPDIEPTPEPSNVPVERPKAEVAPLPEDKGEQAALVPAPVALEDPQPPSAFAHLVDRYARGVRMFGVAFAFVLGALVFSAVWLVRRSRRERATKRED